jgi:hypothetical protein
VRSNGGGRGTIPDPGRKTPSTTPPAATPSRTTDILRDDQVTELTEWRRLLDPVPVCTGICMCWGAPLGGWEP